MKQKKKEEKMSKEKMKKKKNEYFDGMYISSYASEESNKNLVSLLEDVINIMGVSDFAKETEFFVFRGCKNLRGGQSAVGAAGIQSIHT